MTAKRKYSNWGSFKKQELTLLLDDLFVIILDRKIKDLCLFYKRSALENQTTKIIFK